MTGPASDRTILVTGGQGRLGTELLALDLGGRIVAPDEREMDITSAEAVDQAFARVQPDIVVHMAAYTDVSGAERNRKACWDVNVTGTTNVVRAAMAQGARLVHISTDYVFEGITGGYREDDPPGPVCNYYALTKLAAEAVARLCRRVLVIRTSFRPRDWPYPTAFTDVHTSQDYVDVIAPEIALAIRRLEEVPFDTLHIATERKSAYDLAKRRREDVQPGSKRQANVALPDDISLDVSRWRELKERWT